jgi:hypothetical protein
MSTLTTLSSSPVLHDQPGTDTPRVAAGEEKLPTIDPESLEATRPVDLDVCLVCMGDGWLSHPTGFLYAQEFNDEACWNCHGTGRRGAA